MPLNNAAMQHAANDLRGILAYGQLHSAAAGTSGTDNVCTSGRVAITWTSPADDGDFGLSTVLEFTGGGAGNPVFSMTFWTASTNGTWYGEIALDGDQAFNSAGEYTVTAVDFDGWINEPGSGS